MAQRDQNPDSDADLVRHMDGRRRWRSQQLARAGLLALALLPSTDALGQSLFGGTGRLPHRDITGSEELRGLTLDYDYIDGGRASYRAAYGIAGAPTTEMRRNYVYVEDTDGTLTI